MRMRFLFLPLLIIALASGIAHADAVITEDPALGAQSYIETAKVSDEWIIARANEGKALTSVSFRNGKWTLVASSNSGFTKQAWITSNAMPYTWMNEKRLDNYFVTSVASHPQGLMVVMSRGARFSDQRLPNRTMFGMPGSAEGYRLTAIGATPSRFLFVESKGTDITAQVGASRSQFPVDFIQDNFAKGYRMTSLLAFGSTWYVVMSKTDGALWDERIVASKDIDAELQKGRKIKLSF